MPLSIWFSAFVLVFIGMLLQRPTLAFNQSKAQKRSTIRCQPYQILLAVGYVSRCKKQPMSSQGTIATRPAE